MLTCMEEAKRLVDKAYKERRERWGLSEAVPQHFREGTGSRGTCGWRLEGGLCRAVFLSLGVKHLQDHASHLSWTPRSKPLVFTKTNLLPGSGSFSSPQLWAGALLSVSPSFLWAHPSFLNQRQAAASQRLGQPHGTPVLLQAASGGHQDRCEGG